MAFNFQAAVNISAEFTGQRAIDQAKRSLNDLGTSANTTSGVMGTLRGSLGGLTKLFSGLGAALALKELGQLAKQAIDLGDSLNDLRQKTGIGVQALSDLKAAAEDGGVNFESLEGSLKKFSVTLAKAQAGSSVASAGFKALGLSVKDFASSDQALFAIADAFSRLEDGPNKAAVAVALFGKAGADMIPVLNGGKESLQGFGIQVSDEFAKQSDRFMDNMNAMGRALKGFGVSVAEFVLPPLNSLFEKLGRVIDQMKTADWSKLGEVGLIGVASGQAEPFRGMADLKRPENYDLPKPGKINTEFLAKDKDKADPAKKKLENQLESERDQIAKLNAELNELVALRELEAQKTSLTTEEYDRRKIAIQESTKAEKATLGFSKQNASAYQDVTKEIIKQKQALEELKNQQGKTFGEGAKEAWASYLKNAQDVSGATKSMFSNVFSGMEDAIVQFVQTGKLEFADLAKQIEADLIRIAVKQAIVFGVNAALGGLAGSTGTPGAAMGGQAYTTPGIAYAANGGIIGPSGHMPLAKYARGGIANSPQIAVFGEGSRPEAFVPLPDGRSIPVTMAGGGGTSVVVHVNVMKGSASEQSAESDTEKGRSIGRMISSAVTEELIKQRRPGGLLA